MSNGSLGKKHQREDFCRGKLKSTVGRKEKRNGFRGSQKRLSGQGSYGVPDGGRRGETGR